MKVTGNIVQLEVTGSMSQLEVSGNIVQGGAFSWAAYWAGLISATVENAAPTKIVMTFSQANTSLLVTDFTIAGKTITLLERDATNKILTLTVSVAVAYGDVVVITFVKSGQTKIVTNNITHPLVIEDGSTVAWFDSSNVASITKDGGNLVSVWGDLIGLGNHLLHTGADGIKPVWSANGVLFDGANDFMKCVAFTFKQPEFIYIVFRQMTWAVDSYIYDGNTTTSGMIYQNGVTPRLRAHAGIASAENANLPLNTWGIARVLYNGAASSFQINETAQLTGNWGDRDMDGFTLGARGAADGRWSNIQVKEIILRKAADSAATQTSIYNYLAVKYGI